MQGEFQIIITMSANGEINVSGPIGDKVLCYGLLSVAHDVIKDYVPTQIAIPKGVIIPPLRGVGN